MCAGAIYVATGASKVSEMRGLGRSMPIVFSCFLVGALCVIGLPPFAGMWSKFLLLNAAFGTKEWVTAAAMIVSSLLGLIYLAPVALMALLQPVGDGSPRAFIRPDGAPGPVVAAVMVTAAACVVLFVLADAVVAYLAPMTGRVR